MKSFLVIVIFALVGFCFSSAAFKDVDENEMQESVEVYKSILESILRDASKQIKENLAFDENMAPDNFERENIFDDEQYMTFTEEEEGEEEARNDELSPVEENIGSGIGCSWRGLNGQCCQSLRIKRIRLRICLSILIQPPSYMQLQLKLNGKTIFRKTVGVRNRSFNVCLRKGPLRICFNLYNLNISSHSARLCVGVTAKVAWFRYRKNLGCISKRFALHEIPTITNESNPSSVHKKHNDALLS